MTFTEEQQDLFSVPDDYYLAHCVSADFALGKGIAAEFEKRFHIRNAVGELIGIGPLAPRKLLPPYFQIGEVVVIDRVFNLVTKEHYWQKPDLFGMAEAVVHLVSQCHRHKVKKLAMPRIGCGLDRLEWGVVREMLKQAFSVIDDIEILVCYL
jgi:O-acetyl-ADP-ribose deacetylase (regulator of RNase III)